MDEDTAAHVFKVATRIAKAYKQSLDYEGLNIVQNNGEAAGQTVFHFHMHIIPRFKNSIGNCILCRLFTCDITACLSSYLCSRWNN